MERKPCSIRMMCCREIECEMCKVKILQVSIWLLAKFSLLSFYSAHGTSINLPVLEVYFEYSSFHLPSHFISRGNTFCPEELLSKKVSYHFLV